MCGILAVLGCVDNSQAKRARIIELSRRLKHRGPDWSGLHCHGDCYLAHQRLAIVDPTSGDQPLYNEDKTVVVTVNGEIYNHKELRQKLSSHQFRTGSDCEVIAHLYEEYGEEFIDMLDGMFSFVLLDTRDKSFIAARDAIGITPLYLGWGLDGSTWFASEMKALSDDCERFISFPPGHIYSSKQGGLRRWYNPPWFTEQIPSTPYDPQILRQAFEKAVLKRLMTDVPFGVLLSGGLDSSLVAAVTNRFVAQSAAAQQWGSQLHTFCIGLKGSPDLKFAKEPHLQRTKLCDMKDGDLEPLYVKRREQLKELVASIIRPKIVQGKSLNGKEFVSFLEQILEALNKGEIPSTGSLVEIFNKDILERCLKLYSERMGKLQLPLPEGSLQQSHDNSRGEAMRSFDQQHFGRHHAKKSVTQLDEEIQKVYRNVILKNEYQSSKLCEALYTNCEDMMDRLQVLRLPSMAKFNAGLQKCNHSFEHECVGPSKTNYEQRMMKMLGKSKSQFIKDYNQRLFNWLVAFSLVMVVIGRFIIKFILIEMGAWLLFIFLETYTRMFWSAESLYYNPVWHFIVATWETLVYSPVLDLDRWAIPLGVIVSLFVLYWRCYGKRKHGSRWILPLYSNNKNGRSRPRSD